MAFQAVPRTAVVEVRQRIGAARFENTLYFEHATGYSQADLDALAQSVYTEWEAGQLSLQSTDVALVETYAKGLSTLNDLEAYYADVIEPVGGISSPALPLNVAFAIKFSCGLTGRSTRGRNYVGGLPESAVTGQLVGGTTANGLTAAYSTIAAEALALGWTHVVVSRYTAGAARVTGETFPVTTWTYTDLTVDTMRKRLS